MTDERMLRPDDAGTPGADQTPVLEGAKDLDPAELGPDADVRSLSERGTSESKRAGDPADLEPSVPTQPAVPTQPPTQPTVPAQPAADAAPARPAGPTVSSVSPDVDLAQDASPLPGAHRGGFSRLPTAPVSVTVETAPAEPGGEFTPDDTTWAQSDSAFSRGLSGWALGFAVVGLLVSMFVGWGFPIGIVAIVSGIIALRRPLESRAVAVWAIVLGALSILYSAGWLLFAGMQAGFLG